MTDIRLVIDVAAERDRIRHELKYLMRPLADKGTECELSLAAYGDRPYRPIVEELLLAFWETTAHLDSTTAQTKISLLRRFFAFLDDRSSPVAGRHAPVRLADLTFDMMRDYEHWLFERPASDPSKLGERIDQLRAYVEANRLPTRVGRANSVVKVTAIETALGFPAGYINKYPELFDIVTEAALRQGLDPAKSSVIRWPRRRLDGQRLLSKRSIEDSYYTLTKLLRFLARHQRHLLADDFELAEFSSPQQGQRRLGTPSLSPAEHQTLRRACLSALRQIKSRILVEGPACAARGRPQPDAGESAVKWGEDLDNLVAYLDRHAPGQLIGKGNRRDKHAAFMNAVVRRPEKPIEIATWLVPSRLDLVPFIILMGLSDHAPLNLEALMTLHVDPANPRKHCVRESPTPGNKRIYFGKPRAQRDQAYVDVPHRSELDLPGLIETVMKMTAPLRQRAKPADRHTLWLYLSEKGGVVATRPGVVSLNLLRQFVVKHDVRHDGKLLLDLYFRRLRPTSISETALSHGVEEARRRAAHASPIETLIYVNNPTNEPRLRAIVRNAQSKAMASIKTGFANRPSPAEVERLASGLGIPPGTAQEIILGRRDKLFSACVDDENGLGPVPSGKTCGRYEACLVCPNSVILARHLPRLLAYQAYWLGKAAEMSEEAWGESHALNCAIVDAHLKKFPPDVVELARAEASATQLPIAGLRFKLA